MKFIYNIIIKLYYFGIILISPFNKKAKNWIEGRKNQFQKINILENISEKRYWFHCASLGEFEQGRPIIEKIKLENPEIKIVLTFFSSSGFLHVKNYKFADYIFYLPLDTKQNAQEFIKYIKPQKVFFIKYEFWYHFINQLNKNNIPTYLVSAIFRKNQLFFKWYGCWYKNILEKFTGIFVQNLESKTLLENHNIKNVTISGDTRFDRVCKIADENIQLPIFEKFAKNNLTFVAGSTWEKDEEIIIEYINKHPNNFKYVIVPHDISKSNIERISKNLQTKIQKLSDIKNDEISDEIRVIIVDSIGLLSKIYKYAEVSYVGGGFGKGIHNILEASVFGSPVLFGTNYKKFSEATESINLGFGFSIKNSSSFQHQINHFYNNKSALENLKIIINNYFVNKKGASDIIIKTIS